MSKLIYEELYVKRETKKANLLTGNAGIKPRKIKESQTLTEKKVCGKPMTNHCCVK